MVFRIVNVLFMIVSVIVLFFICSFSLADPMQLKNEINDSPILFFSEGYFSYVLITFIYVTVVFKIFDFCIVDKHKLKKYYKTDLIILLIFALLFLIMKMVRMSNFIDPTRL